MKNTMEKKKNVTRNSSLELLKILAMLCIVAHHYVIHGYGNFMQGVNQLAPNYLFLQEVGMYGSLSCNFFALITGYFVIMEPGDLTRRRRKVVKLLLEMWFYSILIYLFVVKRGIVAFQWMDLIKSLFPFLWGNWYIIAYLWLYLLVPYLNPGLQSMKKETYRKMLLVMLVVWSVIPTFTKFVPTQWQFSNVDFMVVMYCIGAYIRLHVLDKPASDRQKRKYLWVGIGAVAFMVLSVIVLDKAGELLQLPVLLENGMYFDNLYMIPSVVLAIAWFLVFANMKFYAGWINAIAASVFSVYLIHENSYLRGWIWGVVSPNYPHLNQPYGHFVVKVLAVFAGCVLIDIVRRGIMTPVERIILKHVK